MESLNFDPFWFSPIAIFIYLLLVPFSHLGNFELVQEEFGFSLINCVTIICLGAIKEVCEYGCYSI